MGHLNWKFGHLDQELNYGSHPVTTSKNKKYSDDCRNPDFPEIQQIPVYLTYQKFSDFQISPGRLA
jgi:hypothetical protein